MAAVIEDRIQESTISTGTGNIVLAGAITAHRTFASVCSVGDTFYGMIVAVNANGAPTGQWESGHYTYAATNTVARTSVTANSSGTTSPVNFLAGTKRVFIDVTAAQVKLFQTNTSLSVTPYGQTASGFTSLIYQDEFNVTALDSTRYNKAFFGMTDDADQNFSVANGALNIWPSSPFVYRTIDTDGKFYFNPGCYIEVEARMNTGKGCTPAIWLYNHDTGVRPVVTLAKSQPGLTSSGWGTSAYKPIDFLMDVQSDNGVTVGSYRGSTYFTVPDLSAAFHKYAMKWETTGITFFYDGVQVGAKITTSAMSARMYLLMSLWFNASPDAPDTTNTPQGIANAFQVNYVRAWQLA